MTGIIRLTLFLFLLVLTYEVHGSRESSSSQENSDESRSGSEGSSDENRSRSEGSSEGSGSRSQERRRRKAWKLPEPELTLKGDKAYVSLSETATAGACSVQLGNLLNCVKHMYTVPTGFEAPGSGRRNPERGFYRHTETKTSTWSPVSDEPLASWVELGYTLIYRNYVLDTFASTDISDDILDKIREDFEAVKEAGLKVILRFCYSINQEVIDDAPPAQLKKHLEQLTPILQEYVGVIALVQTGFIGVWGEWYYTANYGNEGVISDEDYENRRQVVNELLEALPTARQIELRTPNHKRMILERQTACTEEEAHTSEKVARIGHHNDCFLASDTDFGTYIDKAEEYPYLQSDTTYVSQGGETCNPNSPRSDCTTALKELSELHYTYLNSQYHPDVLTSWEEQGCYNEVDLSLGYRLLGVSSSMPRTVVKGSSNTVSVKITNGGWASPLNYRSAMLVMINKLTEEKHESPLNVDLDLRDCLPGDFEFDMTLSVPMSASEGEYEVLLKLPDGEESLAELPEYNIVMENLEFEDDPDSRLNSLGPITVIS